MSYSKVRRRRGSLTIEAALFLPALGLMLFAGLEYGWMAHRLRQLDTVVEQAARVGASRHGTTAMVRTAADRMLERAGLAELEYTLEVTPADVSPTALHQGTEFDVTLSVPYTGLSFTGLGRPAPSLLPVPTHLVVRAAGIKQGAL